MYIVDVIRGRAGFSFTFWVFWFTPIALIWLFSYLVMWSATDGGTNWDGEWSGGVALFLITAYFLKMAINLTFGVGVFLAFLSEGVGLWGIIGVLIVCGEIFNTVKEIFTTLL